jgi:hypothetical protein
MLQLEITMLDSDTANELIKPHMAVVCSENGQHHYIPLAWVTSVDDNVHVDRPGKQAMQEWTTTPTARA